MAMKSDEDEEHSGPDDSQSVWERNEASVTDHYGRPLRICHAAKCACLFVRSLDQSFPVAASATPATAVGGPGVMRAGGP